MIHFALPILLASAAAATDPRTEAVSVTHLSVDPVELAPYLVPAVQDTKKESAFSYTYIQAGYYSTDIDVIDETSDAVYARGSLGLFKILYVFVDYAAQSLDDVSTGAGNGDIDNDSIQLGVGAHFTINPKLDLLGEAAYIYDDVSSDDIANLDDSNDGWSLLAGARWMVLPWEGGGLELNGGYRWQDREALYSDDEVGAWEAGARFHFLKLFSIGANYAFIEDDSQFGLDARISF